MKNQNENKIKAQIKSVVWPDIGAAIREDQPDLEYILPGLPAGSVGGIIGTGGVGKSMFALQLAMAIAGGHNQLGLGSLSTGPVIFLSAEDPIHILLRRVHLLGAGLDMIEQASIQKNLHLGGLIGKSPNIQNAQWQDWLARLLEKKPRLLILDTLRRFHQANEIDSGEMSDVLSVLESLATNSGAAIIFMHHYSKSSILNGVNSQQSSRGSSVLSDHIRWQVNIAGIGESEAKKLNIVDAIRSNYCSLAWTKTNYGPPKNTIYYRRGIGGELVPSDIGGEAHAQVYS